MTDQELKEVLAGFAAENAAGFAALREAQTRTEKVVAAHTQSIKDSRTELISSKEEVTGMGKSQGMVAEDFFYNSLSHDPTVAGIHYDSVTRGLERSKHGKSTEIDILLENGNCLAMTEVKHRVRAKDIVQVQKTLASFRDFFPQYKGYKVYAGIAGFSFDDGVVSQAHEQGFFVLKRKGDLLEVDAQGMRAF